MGNTPTTARLQHLTNLGFTVAESRAALRHTDGDVEKAAAILQRLRRQKAARANSAAGLVDRVNDLLREQKPWSEFFERFLWPEHIDERLQTNLLYYRANYLVVTGGVVIVALLLQPARGALRRLGAPRVLLRLFARAPPLSKQGLERWTGQSTALVCGSSLCVRTRCRRRPRAAGAGGGSPRCS